MTDNGKHSNNSGAVRQYANKMSLEVMINPEDKEILPSLATQLSYPSARVIRHSPPNDYNPNPVNRQLSPHYISPMPQRRTANSFPYGHSSPINREVSLNHNNPSLDNRYRDGAVSSPSNIATPSHYDGTPGRSYFIPDGWYNPTPYTENHRDGNNGNSGTSDRRYSIPNLQHSPNQYVRTNNESDNSLIIPTRSFTGPNGDPNHYQYVETNTNNVNDEIVYNRYPVSNGEYTPNPYIGAAREGANNGIPVKSQSNPNGQYSTNPYVGTHTNSNHNLVSVGDDRTLDGQHNHNPYGETHGNNDGRAILDRIHPKPSDEQQYTPVAYCGTTIYNNSNMVPKRSHSTPNGQYNSDAHAGTHGDNINSEILARSYSNSDGQPISTTHAGTSRDNDNTRMSGISHPTPGSQHNPNHQHQNILMSQPTNTHQQQQQQQQPQFHRCLNSSIVGRKRNRSVVPSTINSTTTPKKLRIRKSIPKIYNLEE
ncbi:hypothetical protein H4219_001402 [Mycoemilia scoparia]|uniref:Uncharacterized protein n=1 Tax=Mycoemilia scoparia TaxID=417184 RepID=A0A9W8A6Q1_9FUNG|nr:hypothetical protein H4219_001402 [Mycoemilia scoparia]